MIELNDSNASYSQNGISVFVKRIDADEDIYISSSCVFLSDIVTSGSIRAQYDLTVNGSISAGGDVEIGGNLGSAHLKGNNISVGGSLNVKDEVSCKSLFVTGDAFVGSVFCTNIEVYGLLVSTSMVDAEENIMVNKFLVALDYVMASGKVTVPEVISHEITAGEESIGKRILLSADILNNQNNSDSPTTAPSSIADSDISEIFNAHSPLAIEIDDCAVFLDRLNDDLCNRSYTDERMKEYLQAFSDFFPQYEELLRTIQSINPVLSKDIIDDDTWFDDFNICVGALIRLPLWFMESLVAKQLHEKILRLLSYQSTRTLYTKSLSTWTQVNYHAKYLRKTYVDNPTIRTQIDYLQERLRSNIGLKAPFLNLVFTQE